jgi:hypothetical protein
MKKIPPLPKVEPRLRTGLLKDLPAVDKWLRSKGVQNSLWELYHDAALCPDCTPQLLDLLELPYSLDTQRVVAEAITFRKPNAAQKHRAFDVFMGIIKKRAGEEGADLSDLILNELTPFITPDRVHEIGKMTFDEQYGESRDCFTYVLLKIGNADATNYLLRAAKDPVTAALALHALAKLRAEETATLCEAALANPEISKSSRQAIKSTYAKVKHRAMKPGNPSHKTNDAIPKGLAEWSANLDGPDLPKVLRKIRPCVEAGFGTAEISEARSAAANLSPDQTTRLKFPVKAAGIATDLWMEIFCDDEDAFDLYLFGDDELIGRIETGLESLMN